MALLILGLALWFGAHYFKRLAPKQRQRLGEPGKGLVALLIVGGVVAMVYGYRWAEFIPVWNPPAAFTHANNTLMLLAFWVYGSSMAKGPKAWPANRIRHPQLIGFAIWAVAHLMVNGDLASIILFGGLLIWSVGSIQLINRAKPDWTPPGTAGTATWVRLAVITIVLFGGVAWVHNWLGKWPFPA